MGHKTQNGGGRPYRKLCPVKTRIFMWLAIGDKSLTWEILCRRNISGPHTRILYKKEKKTIVHLLILCPYLREVWIGMDPLIEMKYYW